MIGRVRQVFGTEAILATAAGEIAIDWPGPLPAPGSVWTLVDGRPGECLHAGGATDPKGDAWRWHAADAAGRSRLQILGQRHKIRRAVRDFLDRDGFIEIDAPLLVRGTTPDAEIDSFRLDDRCLVTSCEYQIKRLEIGGLERSYTLTQNFRAGDAGRWNNPEFTMLEWARVGGTLEEIEADAAGFTLAAQRALGGEGPLAYQGRVIDLTPPWPRLTIREAVALHFGHDLPDFSAPALAAALAAAGIDLRPGQESDRALIFGFLIDALQPHLGHDKPVFLTGWPGFQTASTAGDSLVERSELFIAGIELADGFPTLTDASAQRAGFDRQLRRRAEIGHAPMPLDDRFLAGIDQGLPRGAGMALGFDRLVMLLTDQPGIDRVLAFSHEEC